jgi:hypothetical protein
MNYTYYSCSNLKTAVCGNNVAFMVYAYSWCTNLTTAVCGPLVFNMWGAYMGCSNLTTAVCGRNVNCLTDAYRNCTNLTTAVFGPNVKHATEAYENTSVFGNVYVYSNKIERMVECFNRRRTEQRLNIYVHKNTQSLHALTLPGSDSIGNNLTWTNDVENSGCYYNTTANIYIYPVANVEEIRIANGDPDYMGNL